MPPTRKKPDEGPVEQDTIDDAAPAEAGDPDPHPPVPDEADLDRREREAQLRERELRLAERERELAAREAAAEQGAAAATVAAGPPWPDEYRLMLDNGEVVQAPSAAATHYTGADGELYAVIRATPIPGRYGVPHAELRTQEETRRRADWEADQQAQWEARGAPAR